MEIIQRLPLDERRNQFAFLGDAQQHEQDAHALEEENQAAADHDAGKNQEIKIAVENGGKNPVGQPAVNGNNNGNAGDEILAVENDGQNFDPNVQKSVGAEAIVNDPIYAASSSTSHQALLDKTVITLESSEVLKKEILKSIVYGGLTELVASLGIITSAASTNATTGKIVALSLTNLIAGVFVIGYQMAELWINKPKNIPNETEPEEVDKYEELLGDRKNYRLHLTVAILSFILFGLVPPLVYGFTFRKPEDRVFKIPATTIVSVLCIALLAAFKAHIQRPENCLVYIQTIGNHIIDGVGASVLTTFGGDLIGKYVDQSGWFEFEQNKTQTLFLPGITFKNPTSRSF